ncbi:hypothetical protein TRVA0_015S00254 [Trichomonascus vanleenenianus]|uniref:uncharacterized protein n=1 Tax=Trichomonascus vanleenenianus TaxID=2268995 RepID=UPI003ECB5F44
MKFSAAAIALAASVSTVLAGFETYPSVPHTASINGFADPIYDKLPACAKECVKASTSNTPCPYWDPGCLCYMPQWGSIVADCFVENCADGADVSKAVDLAVGICVSVGAGKWVISPDASTALAAAETRVVTAATTAPAVDPTSTGSETSSAKVCIRKPKSTPSSAPAPTTAPAPVTTVAPVNVAPSSV